MKRKVHKTMTLKAGKSFSIACKTPAKPTTMHAYDDRDVTCKWCVRAASMRALSRGAVRH